jgi:putative PEP-CTERM system TPR-repeat lipoprotein
MTSMRALWTMGTMLTTSIVLLLAGCGRTHNDNQLIAEAQQFMAKGETRSAVIQLKNVLQQTPSNGGARLILGKLYLDSGDVMSAEKELRRALEFGANPGDVMPPLGRSLLLQGQYQKVLDEVKADEQQPQLQSLRGHALIGLNRGDEARALFEKVLVRHPDNPAALLGLARMAMQDSQYADALGLIDRALARHPDDVDAWRTKGDLLRLQSRNPDALLAYQQVLKLRPTQMQAHVDIASLHIQSGKVDEARKELGIARQVSPNNLMLLYTTALLDFQEKKLVSAQERLQMVLRVAPEHLPSNLLMGAVLRAQGNNTQAEQYLRKFLDTNPGHPYASKLLASVLVSNGAADRALAIVEPLFDSHQQDLEMMSLAGEIYMRLRQFPKAVNYFERASVLAPQATMLHAALAMSHMGMGENSRAIAELERATSLDAKSSRAGVLLVLTQLRAKEYAKALVAVKRLESQGDNPMVQNLKGGVLLMSRDRAGARASFEKALALEPLYLPALDNLTQMDLADKQPERDRLRLEKALAKDPKNTDIMTALANWALKQRQPAMARSWLERAAQERPDALEPSLRLANYYSRTNELPKALVLAEKLMATNASNPEVVALMAGLQARSGNNDASLENLNKLAVLEPNSAEIQLRIAEARNASRDTEGALQALNKALSLQPDFQLAQVATVRLLLEQKAYPKAMQTVRGFQKARSDAPLGYKLEGDVLMAQKQIQPALALYQKAYDMQPSGALLVPLHSALVQAGKSREASSRVQKWLDAHGDDLTTRLYFASSLMAEKDYPASTAQFEQLVKVAPNHVVGLNNLAWLYQQQKDPRALGIAEQAYKLAPGSAAVIDTLAWLLVEQGKLERAVPLLKQAVSLAPNNTEIKYHLGVALGKTGDKRAAREQLEPLMAAKDFERRDAVKALLSQ